MKWIKKLFGIKDNDWIQIWAHVGKWDVQHVAYWTDKSIYTTTELCSYTILYSRSRNRYKLFMSGYAPKEHRDYPIVIEKLNQLVKSNEYGNKGKG